MRRALLAVTASMMLLAAARAEGPSRSQTPQAGSTPAALGAAVSKKLALQMPLMRVGRVWATATPLKTGPNAGKILIVGGFGHVLEGDTEVEPVWRSTELYDPMTNSFAAGPKMHIARREQTAAMIAAGPSIGKILIAGGVGPDDPLVSTERYEPLSNRFITGPKMSTVRHGHTATAIASGPNAGKILIAGGGTASTELYDPASNRFSPGPSMHDSRMTHTATAIPSGPNAGKVLIAGGSLYTDAPASTELYDPMSNTFVSGPPMNVARESATATAIASGPNAGKILIVGGFGGNHTPLSSTELYDPATNRFTPGPTMNVARRFHTATAIASGPNAGMILIAGGEDGGEGASSYLGSTEIYNPLTNTFAAGPTMKVARCQNTATAITSGPNAGMILLAGGASYTGVLPSAELYDPATNKFAPPPDTPEMELELMPASAFDE